MTRPSSARRAFGTAVGFALAVVPKMTWAQASPPTSAAVGDVAPDVVVPEPAPPRRAFSIEWNPLSLIVGRASAQLLVVPVDHHALVLNPFFAWTTTNGIDVYDAQGNATQLPVQKFTGFGAELGYRYYAGTRGPRGFFIGPSLIVAAVNVQAQSGASTSYADLGIAADAGYQLLVVDRVSLAVGAGVQYAMPTTSVPSQQFPADVYANGRVFPRALASIGWAF
jgi:hypothetical protein